ncbi:putative inactive purple acid phosphatase 9 [Tetrabaena socialis]|uniref:Putative inactive purple acid phosphatase 9 n=1 Tax=Tetrabaena socialis TaxID=47790 RepID=A0A2J8A1U2_9CHLO|nr:putative inactive purple acid phosphatase 9 [Tetrabaena socialis]|eukprot:PNH06496.1 putative inactive purple acid phosphatase 9 [Tetrabaena socialis]
MSQIEPLSSRMPYMVGIGNHEAGPCKGAGNDPSGEAPYNPDWGNFGPESGGECGAMAAHRFLMPGENLALRGGAFAAMAAAAVAPAGAERGRGGGAWEAAAASKLQLPRALTAVIPSSAGTILAAGVAEQEQEEQQEQQEQEQQEQEAEGGEQGADELGADAGVGGLSAHAPRAKAPFWYSFEYGSVHFTVISTEHDLTAGSKQRRWLEADLEGVDRCRTPWLVVALHRPM